MIQKSPLKRRLVNLLAILVILAVGLTANRFYASGEAVSNAKDFPRLTGLRPIPEGAFDIRPEAGQVMVAVEVSPTISDLDEIAGDVVTIFKWGRNYYGPVKCGPDYPANLCLYGEVNIILVDRTETFGPEGKGERFEAILEMGCDQLQIDKLLEMKNPPANLDSLFAFLAQASEVTIGTGCWATEYDPPKPFNGF